MHNRPPQTLRYPLTPTTQPVVVRQMEQEGAELMKKLEDVQIGVEISANM